MVGCRRATDISFGKECLMIHWRKGGYGQEKRDCTRGFSIRLLRGAKPGKPNSDGQTSASEDSLRKEYTRIMYSFTETNGAQDDSMRLAITRGKDVASFPRPCHRLRLVALHKASLQYSYSRALSQSLEPLPRQSDSTATYRLLRSFPPTPRARHTPC